MSNCWFCGGRRKINIAGVCDECRRMITAIVAGSIFFVFLGMCVVTA